MTQPNRSPAAIRLARPYGSEKEFVEGDFAFLGRPTLFLPNAPARAAGDVVRFEFLLNTGAPVFRGEAQVVAHHAASGPKSAGLEVRITRMDAKSKAIHDQVKERRRAAPKSLSPAKPVESIAPAKVGPSLAAPPPAAPTEVAPRPVVAAVAAPAPPPARAPEPPQETASETSGIHLSPVRARVAPPPNRDEILDRLRERARQLAARGALPVKRAKQSA